MAAPHELRVISRAIKDQNVAPLLQRGVDKDWFPDPEARKLFVFVSDHYSKYGQTPTAVTVRDNFPTARILDVNDSIEFLLDKFVEYRRSEQTYRMVKAAAEMLDDPDNTDAVIQHLRRSIEGIDVSTPTDRDLEITFEATKRYDEYLDLKSRAGGLLGPATGFPTIDDATAGLQNGQLITIVAPPKCGKSQLALKIASNCHADGLVPMYQSFEMSNFEQQQRFDAMRAGISHGRLRAGSLLPPEEAKYQTMLNDLEAHPTPMWFTDSSVGTTVSAIGAKIAQHDPDVVFVDGVYLMTDEVTGECNTPQALTNITRAFKRLAQRLDKPIVITTQTLLWKMQGKRKIDQNSVGYSSSFVQDSDVVLGLERTEDDDDDRRILKIVASRNCGPAEVELLWDWSNGTFAEMGAAASAIINSASHADEWDDFDLDGFIDPDYGVA